MYAQKGNVIVEVPENFFVSQTTNTITVKSTNILYRGKVIANVQNGELVMTRDRETEEAVILSILTGIVFELVSIIIGILTC